MNKRIKKVLALGCSALVLMSSLSTINVYANEEDSIVKEEKVYGILNTDGSTEKLVVSNYIHSPKELKEIEDVSELEDIVNLKNGEVPTKNGDCLTWNMAGHELYYQGTTNKELPVTTSITYMLDGKEISADQLEGLSGNLEIRITQENHMTEMIEVNGEERELYVPFYTLASLGLKTKTFSNVEINKGKIVNDGNYFLVIGGLMPGMKENLGENDYIEFEEEIIITAEVNDYQKPPIYLVMSTKMPKDEELEVFEALDELDQKMLEFDEAADDLELGANKFYDAESQYVNGLDTAFNGVYDINTGIKLLSDKMLPLQSGLSNLTKGITDYAEGATEFSQAVTDIAAGLTQLVSGLEEMSAGLIDLNSKTEMLSAGLHKEDESLIMLHQGFEAFASTLDVNSPAYAQYSELLAGLKLASESSTQLAVAFDQYGAGVAQLNAGATTMITSSAKLIAVPDVLSEKASLMNDGALALSEGESSLSAGITQLNSGVKELASGSQSLADGVAVLDSKSKDLLSGAKDLRDGVSKFNQEGVKAITSEIKDKEDKFNELLEIYEALEVVSEHYTNFTGQNEKMEQDVEFILKVNE